MIFEGVAATITSGFACCLWIYCMVIFRRNKEKNYFKKRGVVLLQAYLWLSGMNILVFFPLGNIASEWNSLNAHDHIWGGIFWYSTTSISFMLSDQYCSIFILRIILQFVNIRRAEDSDDWKKQIDPNYTSFALKYYHILGNQYKLFAISIFIGIIELIFIAINIIINGMPYSRENYNKTYTIVLTFMFVVWIFKSGIGIYCGIKMRHFIDDYGIYYEFKYLIIAIIVGSVIEILVVVVGFILGYGFRTVFISFTYCHVGWVICSWYLTIILVHEMNTCKHKELEVQVEAKRPRLEQFHTMLADPDS